MSHSSSDRDPVERLAEEFLARHRRGEQPALTEYTERYPQHANAIRRLFPALLKMEQLKPASDELTGPDAHGDLPTAEPTLDRLGDYRILREVGRGGMGIVYEAEQQSLGRHVALKVLPGHVLLDSRQLGRFQREAKAAARLHHSNIVPVYGVGEDKGLHYYVMQFIQGQGLDQVVAELRRLRRPEQVVAKDTADEGARQGSGPASRVSASAVAQALLSGHYDPAPAEGQASASGERPSPAEAPSPGVDAPRAPPTGSSVPLPGSSDASAPSGSGRPFWQGVARIGIQVAEALVYAHHQGTLHRDIKPSNLLLDTQGTVWVTDFGLAKTTADVDNLTHTGDIVGTVRYLAPERLQGQADARSDLYALGLTLYELLTLRSAFDAADRNKLLVQVKEAEPPRPRQVNSEVPRDLETVVLKALERDPAHRYQTARELADDLKRFVAGEPIRARRVSVWHRVVLWAKRRPAVAALCLVSGIAVLALVGITVALAYSRQLEESKTRLEASNQAIAQARDEAKTALEQAHFYQYFHHIALAHAGWREGNLGGTDQLLDECPGGQRNWEWDYLQRLCHAHAMLFSGKDLLLGMAFSPDGQRLACGPGRTVRILDAATRQEIRSLPGHSELISDLAFSPDGQRLAVSCFDGAIKVWEVATGREAFRCQGHKDVVWKVVFSPDGTRLVSASEDQTVRLWDARTGQAISPVLHHPQKVWGIAFSPDGSQIVSGGGDKAVRLWELATGRPVRTFERSAAGSYSPVAFSPDGRRLASADGDGNLTVWDAATGLREQRFSGHRGFVWSVTFSPNGHWLASSGIDQTVRVWEVASGKQLLTLKGHTMEVCRVAFHPDGTWLASASPDGTVRAWPVTTAQEARVLQGRGGIVGGLAYSPDGARLASTAPDQTVTIWDAGTGQVVHTFAYQLLGPPSANGLLEQFPPVAYSPDGSRLAAGAPDGTVPVWDTRTGQLLQRQRPHTRGVWALAYSPDGSRIASAGEDATVLVWEAGTGRIVHELRGHTQAASSVAFSPDGSRLASSSQDNTVMIWDATTGKPLDTLRGHDTWVMGIAFSRDGTRLASASNDDRVIIWEPATGRQVRRLNHASLVWRALFSPDGQRLATCSDDGTIKVWEVATGLETLTLRGHTTRVNCLSFSPDGTRLASGSADGTIRVWDAQPWTAEAAVEREALGLLDYLFTMPLRQADVLDYLGKATSITPQARQRALALVERYREENDPERYHQASWAVVRQPYLNPFQYRFALRQAETACRLARGQGRYQTTLGIAQYRNGQYPEALASLTQAEQLHGAAAAGLALAPAPYLPALTALGQADQLRQTIPANLAFLAMTRHQLGHKEQVQATRARLQETMRTLAWAKDEAAQALAREVEVLIAGK